MLINFWRLIFVVKFAQPLGILMLSSISVLQESLAREGQVVAPPRTEAKEKAAQAAEEDKKQ